MKKNNTKCNKSKKGGFKYDKPKTKSKSNTISKSRPKSGSMSIVYKPNRRRTQSNKK